MSNPKDHGPNPFTEFRPDIPSPARMYDYFLGGKDHFPADREAAERFINAYPPNHVRRAARQNRAFMQRAVRHLAAETDVRQFIDIGAGIPTMGPVHEVAEKIAPESRVVYVDNDLVVIAHSRDMLSGVSNAAIIRHDLREPEKILADQELLKLIDLDRPVAVLLVAILHFIGDGEDPRRIIRGLLDPLPTGSHLVLSHGTSDSFPAASDEGERVYQKATSTLHTRTRAEVARLLDGLEIIDPGLVWLPQWRPDPDTGMRDCPEQAGVYAAVARKA